MTIYLTTASGSRYEALWRHALGDTGFAVSFHRPGPPGRAFGDAIEDLLMAAGRCQPTIVEAPRAVSRADLGRLQIALTRSRRDAVLLNADHLTPRDTNLLQLCASRAGVDAYLIASSDPHPLVAAHAVRLDPDGLTAAWASRPTAGTREATSPCHNALAIGSGPGPGCAGHVDAVECVLTWFPHAVARASVTPAAVRARLHELTRGSRADALRVWTVARDVHHGARAAGAACGLTPVELRDIPVSALSEAADLICAGGREIPAPQAAREVLRVARADTAADGFAPDVGLFAVNPASVRRYIDHGACTTLLALAVETSVSPALPRLAACVQHVT